MDIEKSSIKIHQIILSNFRCFSSETYIGPFGLFNSIFVPNGTGKSFILEEIFFLFCKDI